MNINKIFPYLILIAAIFVSACAAYYSVTGLGKTFAGASFEVIIMASSLEFSNIIATTALKLYWNRLPKLLKYYLIVAVIALSAITSAGIYGFLSDAFQKTADQDRVVQTNIELLKTKKKRFEQQALELTSEREILVKSIGDLRTNLSTNNQYQTIDRKTGQVLTQVQTTSKKGVQAQLDNATAKNDALQIKYDNLNDSISKYDLKIIETEASNPVGGELGPLKYLSQLTGKPMNVIINYFLILIMLVFQPLAIALVLTALFAFGKIEENQPNSDSPKPGPIKRFLAQFKTSKEPTPTPLSEVEVPVETIVVDKPKRKYVRKPKPIEESDPDPDQPIVEEIKEQPVTTIEIIDQTPVTVEKPPKRRIRKVVDTSLNADMAKHLNDILTNNKKKVSD